MQKICSLPFRSNFPMRYEKSATVSSWRMHWATWWRRTQNPDLSLLVSAVVTSSRVGANLSDILDNISSTIKDRIKIRDEVRVLTAQGRMSGLIIGLLPVFIVLMLMMMNPGYIMDFFQQLLGQVMIGAGILLEFIGFFAIKKIVDIKY